MEARGRIFSDDDGLMEGGLSIVVALTGSDRKSHWWKRAEELLSISFTAYLLAFFLSFSFFLFFFFCFVF